MKTAARVFRNRRVRTVCYGILLGMICQLYIAHFGYDSHVVSLGTPVLNALLLFQPELSVFPLMTVMSATACVLRGIHGVVLDGNGFGAMFLPAFYYYGIYTALLSIFCFYVRGGRKAFLMLGMVFCDFAANAVQLACMGHAEGQAVLYSMVIAVVRGVLVWMVYWMYEWEHLYLRKKEHQRHYAQLNQIVSDIYAESFYLRKSMEDLNELTRKSHQLYEDLREQPIYRGAALDIAREAHEIRKDYQRVAQGISSLVSGHEGKSMTLSGIFQIIEDNTKRQMAQRGGKLSFHVRCGEELLVRHFYDLFTILNNLIVNSMDACGETGEIWLEAETAGDELVLLVADDGCGIDEDTLPFIWGAGFSTKYDERTGVMSTGIGLCHVENIVRHLQGKIEVESTPGKGTVFRIRVPLSGIQ